MDSDLIILVPTFRRAPLLRRLLAYFARAATQQEIIIADSSPQDERIDPAAFQGLRVTYQTYSPDVARIEKMMAALESVRAEYVAICADDDFLAPSTLPSCSSFLARHPGYSVVHGRSLVASEDGSAVPYRQRRILARTPALRLFSHLSRYSTTYYSARRRIALLHNLRAARGAFSNPRFEELYLSCLDAIQGDIGMLNRPYLVRQSSRQRQSESAAAPSWRAIISSDAFPAERKHLERAVATALESAGETSETALAAATRSFDAYLARLLKSHRRSPHEAAEDAVAKLFGLGLRRTPDVRLARRSIMQFPRGIMSA